MYDGFQPAAIGVPDEGIGAVQIRCRRTARRQPIERIGDAAQEGYQLGIGHARPSG
jgi:hypothetical protein